MNSLKINIPQSLYTKAFLLFTLTLFIFSCQEEEDSLATIEKTYEELAAEIESLSADLKQVISQYPEYQANMQSISEMPEKDITAKSFEEVITGVNNLADHRKIAKIHYQMRQIREKMYGLPDATGTYTIVDDQPFPEGGIQKFYAYIKDNLKYPTAARQSGIEGRVFIEFVVDADGSITKVRTIKGIGAGCDQEAERVMKNALAWNPGRQDGKPVKVRMVMPITYRLSE